MPEPLVVHLNRESLYEVEPAVDAYEATGPFPVELRNHGQAVHVHLRLDDELSRVAELEAPNHFVDTESTTTVRVGLVEGAAGVAGALDVVTGYGSGSDQVAIAVEDPDAVAERIPVDETLARPSDADGTGGGLVGALDGDAEGTVAVVALGALALALAGTAALVAGSTTVTFGVVAVLVGVVVAAYLLVS